MLKAYSWGAYDPDVVDWIRISPDRYQDASAGHFTSITPTTHGNDSEDRFNRWTCHNDSSANRLLLQMTSYVASLDNSLGASLEASLAAQAASESAAALPAHVPTQAQFAALQKQFTALQAQFAALQAQVGTGPIDPLIRALLSNACYPFQSNPCRSSRFLPLRRSERCSPLH